MSDSFDPMTGEPIIEGQEKKPIGFDPMTGEPIFEGQEKRPIGFDPMTGEPLYPAAVGAVGANAPKKKGIGTIVIIGLAAVLVVALVVFAVIKSGIFMSKSDKILQAAANTAADTNQLIKDLDVSDILSSRECGITIDGSMQSAGINVTYAANSDRKQVYGTADIPGMPDIDFIAEITSDQVRAAVPGLMDHLFVYNYTKEADGYITELLDDDEIEAMNSSFAAMSSAKEQKEYKEKTFKALRAEWKKIEIKKTEKETFKVDNKNRKCAGYSFTITPDNLEDMIDAVQTVYEEEYGDSVEIRGVSVDDVFDDLKDSLDYVEDMDVKVFIYKNKLACVQMEEDGYEMELQFMGGNTRMENVVLEIEGDTYFELSGSKKDKVERMSVEIYGREMMDIEYNTKTGRLSAEGGEYFPITLEATIKSDSKGLVLEVEDFDIEDESISLDGTLTVSKSVRFEELSGEEFDVGNASESDWEDVGDELYDLYSMGY